MFYEYKTSYCYYMKGVIIGAGGVKSSVAPDILIFQDFRDVRILQLILC